MSNEFAIISGIGIIQSLLFSFLLIQKKRKQFSDWILLLWFFIFAIQLSLIVFIDHSHSQIVIIFAKTFTLLHGPLLFIYVREVFERNLSKISLLHLFPFVFFTVSAFFVSSTSLRHWELLLLASKIASLLFYPAYVGYWLKKKLNFIKTARADNLILDAAWLKTLLLVFMIYAGAGIIHVMVDILLGIQFSLPLDALFFVAMLTIIGFYGLKFRVVYDPELPPATEHQKPQYKNSPLKSSESLRLKEQIHIFFNSKEGYLDPNFSLAQLSEVLQVPKHHLSEIINLEMETSFYDLVNTKRIQYAMKRIAEGSEQDITLEGLGYESGFNSKSSFFHHFKKHTGKTPRKYKSEISTD